MDDAPMAPPAEVRPADETPPVPPAGVVATPQNAGDEADPATTEPNPKPVEAPLVYRNPSTRLGPTTEDERKLCERASRPDYLYPTASFLVAGGALAFDTAYVKHHVNSPGLRLTSSGFAGLTIGFFAGSLFASQPKCSPDFVYRTPVEGAVRSDWPLMVSTALVAGAVSPFLVAVVKGSHPISWSVRERSFHVVFPAVAGVVGAFLPYVPLLSPRTLRASRELQKLSVAPPPSGSGLFAAYTTTF